MSNIYQPAGGGWGILARGKLEGRGIEFLLIKSFLWRCFWYARILQNKWPTKVMGKCRPSQNISKLLSAESSQHWMLMRYIIWFHWSFESSEDDFTHYNVEMRSPCAFLSVRVTMRFYRIKIRSLPCDGVHCLGFNSVPSMVSLDKGPELKPWCQEFLISTIEGVSMTIIKSANKDD